MDYSLETQGLGKRYKRTWVLQDCTLQIPAGSVTGLVGLNGAGKTTLMHLIMSLIEPDAGSIRVLGSSPVGAPATLLSRLGFVAQDHPLYRHFSVKDMLTMGSKLNPRWDGALAKTCLDRLQIPLTSSIGKLSGGKQVQVALVMALAKRPEMLLLDEPFANVDVLARREFMKAVLETVAVNGMSVLLSSHSVMDLERACDRMIMLSEGHVQLTGTIEEIANSHKLLIGPCELTDSIIPILTVLQTSQSGRQCSLFVRTNTPISDPSWQVNDVTLEDIVLAYMSLKKGSLLEAAPIKQEVTK